MNMIIKNNTNKIFKTAKMLFGIAVFISGLAIIYMNPSLSEAACNNFSINPFACERNIAGYAVSLFNINILLKYICALSLIISSTSFLKSVLLNDGNDFNIALILIVMFVFFVLYFNYMEILDMQVVCYDCQKPFR